MDDHFPLDSILFSERAQRRGIINVPDDEQLYNINTYLKPGLERGRVLTGNVPWILNGAFRGYALNAVTPGASDTSGHTKGFAADVRVPLFGNAWAVCNFLGALPPEEFQWDQIIYEYGAWMHISFDPRLRRLLTTKLHGQPYRNGLHLV